MGKTAAEARAQLAYQVNKGRRVEAQQEEKTRKIVIAKKKKKDRKDKRVEAETQRRINEGDDNAYIQRQIRDNPGVFKNTKNVTQKDSVTSKARVEKKTKQYPNIISKIGFGGSGYEPNLTVDKEDYKVPGKHKFVSQFEYLADKYYGGDQEAFAKTSQGQHYLNYLSGVPRSKGGGRGILDASILDKIPEVRDEYLLGDPKDITVDMLKTKNFPVAEVRDNLTSDEYFKLTQMLGNRYPEKFPKARSFASGKGIPALGKFFMSPWTTAGTGILNTFGGKKQEKKPDPIFTGKKLDPKLFYDLDNIEQSGLMEPKTRYTGLGSYMGEEPWVGDRSADEYRSQVSYGQEPGDFDPDDPDEPPPGDYDSWGEFYAAAGITEGTGGFGPDGQYYFNYADGGIASLDNGQFDAMEADTLMFRDPIEDDEWEYNV